jgi:hypothetical protein
MRLWKVGLKRTGLLALGLMLFLGALAVGGSGGDRLMAPEPVAVTAYPIPHFRRGDAAAQRFGPLEYRGGLELRGRHRNFGGLSGLRATGGGFLAVTDAGDFVRGRVEERDGAPVGIADATAEPILLAGGKRAKDFGLWDAESLAIDGAARFVGVEREHAILAFDGPAPGAPGRRIPLPAFTKDWADNQGIEALGVIPRGAYAGRLIAIAERSGETEETTEGFVMRQDGSEPFRFRLRRSEGFDVTDLDFLPNGDMVVLERYFSVRRGVAMRLRRVRTADIRPDATVDGATLLTAHGGEFHVDNMEALSIHRGPAGETLLTIVSDDNFSIAQRTLLLRFRWLGE